MSPRRTVAGLGLWLGIGLAGACFDAPRPAVQFSCDPDAAPQCPAGYTCQADGCCHLDGSSYADYEGECQLGGGGVGTGTTGIEVSTGEPSTDTSTDTASESTSGTTSGTASDSTSGDGSTTDATTQATTDGSTAGSSDTG